MDLHLMTARRASIFVTVLTLAAWLGIGAAQAQIRIGLSAPLTGPDAAFGLGLRIGAEQAVADLNRAGGVEGQRLVLVVADDAGDGKQGLAVARLFAAERVGLVVGPFNAGVAGLVLPAYEEAGIVAVLPGTSVTSLTAKGLWNVFRTGPNDAEQGARAGAYITERHAGQRIGLVHDKSPYGRGLAEAVSRGLKGKGQPEVAFEPLARGERDASGLAARLKRVRVDAVYFGGLAPEAIVLLRGLREAGMSVALVGSDGLRDPAFAQAGPMAEGTVMTVAPDPRRLPETKGARPLRTPEADMVAPLAYAAVEVLRQGLAGAPPTTGGIPDGKAVAQYLHQGQPIRTVLGELAYDAKGDLKSDPRRPAAILQVWRRTPDGRLDYAGNEVAY